MPRDPGTAGLLQVVAGGLESERGDQRRPVGDFRVVEQLRHHREIVVGPLAQDEAVTAQPQCGGKQATTVVLCGHGGPLGAGDRVATECQIAGNRDVRTRLLSRPAPQSGTTVLWINAWRGSAGVFARALGGGGPPPRASASDQSRLVRGLREASDEGPRGQVRPPVPEDPVLASLSGDDGLVRRRRPRTRRAGRRASPCSP